MKKFTVNCDFGGQLSPFSVYIGDPEPAHNPLHFQADWLSKQRGGSIPTNVIDAISQLKMLADKNHVLLEELCVYALGTARDDTEQVVAAGEDNNVIASDEAVKTGDDAEPSSS